MDGVHTWVVVKVEVDPSSNVAVVSVGDYTFRVPADAVSNTIISIVQYKPNDGSGINHREE